MCLILLAHDAHPDYRLVVAANRDEFYGRPAAPAAWWPDAPEVLAGRDLREGGTWLGITRGGRFAAVTNFRDAAPPRPGAPSRGWLVGDFLRGPASPDEYLATLAGRAGEYNGFGLLAGDAGSLHYLSNRGAGPAELAPGVYGLSNHLLDTPWPKVERGKAGLREVLAGPAGEVEARLLELLADRAEADGALLPDTGVGVERERALSALFIATPRYGTRASTVLTVGRDGRVRMVERTVGPGREPTEVRHEFSL
ncbi:MAG TPA: NRDE family protein [Longimicrobiaceae bacterium]|nr:NRDE family protein [Longimicrobiaceae bacterium]